MAVRNDADVVIRDEGMSATVVLPHIELSDHQRQGECFLHSEVNHVWPQADRVCVGAQHVPCLLYPR